jgi:hypothetical protein
MSPDSGTCVTEPPETRYRNGWSESVKYAPPRATTTSLMKVDVCDVSVYCATNWRV